VSDHARPGAVADADAGADAVPALQAVCCCLQLQALTGSCRLPFLRQLCSFVASSLDSAHLVACDADEAPLQMHSGTLKVAQQRLAAAAAGQAAQLQLSW